MKILLNILIIASFFWEVNGQTPKDSSKSAGILGSASILEYTVKGYLEPYVARSMGNKQLIAALTLLVASNLGYQSPQSPRLTGTRLGYRFWPGTRNQKLDFYISADLRLQRLTDVWNANLYNENFLDYQEYQLRTVEFSVENYLGYGLVFNVNESFRINQGVGLGWYLSNLDVKSANGSVHALDVVDYRGYDSFGFIWNVSFGFSYRFIVNDE